MVALTNIQKSAIKYHLNHAKVTNYLDLSPLDLNYTTEEIAYISSAIATVETALTRLRSTTPILVLSAEENIVQNNQTTNVVVRPGSTTTTTNNYGNRNKKNYKRLGYQSLYSEYINSVEALAKTLGIQL